MDTDVTPADRGRARAFLDSRGPRLDDRLPGENLPRIRVAKIIPTRACWAGCRFCSFSRYEPMDPTFRVTPLSPDAAEAAVRGVDADTVKITGGLSIPHRSDYLTGLIARLRAAASVPIQAFSAVEVDHFGRRESRPGHELLREWQQAGMTRLGPGGADLLVDEIRQLRSPYRLSRDRWLEIHRLAHARGIPTAAGLVISGADGDEAILAHLEALAPLAEGFTHLEIKWLDTARTPLAVLPPPRLDQQLRTIAAAKALLPTVPIHLHRRFVPDADSEAILAAAGLDAVLETVKAVEP